MNKNFIAVILIILLLFMPTISWTDSESDTTYNFIDYMGPLTKGSTWLYSGQDGDGYPTDTRVQIISENLTITNFSGGDAAIPYEINVINFSYDYGRLNQDGSFSSDDNWNEYKTISGGFCRWGYDDGWDSIRVDGGLNYGSSIAIGETKMISAPAYSGGDYIYIGEINASISLIDIETITVPAGTFHDCLHLLFYLDDGDQPFEEEWWAQGVGVVKLMGGTEGEGGKLRELESWESPTKKIYYRDSDGDGYGDPESPYETSSQPTGYVIDNTDCNDYDSSVHPGSTEIRGDGIDQDCNGNDLPKIYSLTQIQVSQLYVSIFGRASEGEGNAYWQRNQEDVVSTANVMLSTDSAKNYFGTTMNDDQDFIEHIYENTLGKTIVDDPDGIAYWVEDLRRGKSRGEVIVSMINAAQEPVNAGNAQDQFNNKVDVSNYVADNIFYFTGDFDQFIYYIDNITHEQTTVELAKDEVDAFVGLNS